MIEFGRDRKAFKPVARREVTFDRWLAEFPATEGRYVRLRVDTTTYLHLERVRIFP